MADHSRSNISQIKLPDGNIYDIHDAAALHNLDFIQVMEFKGARDNEAAIKALTNQPAGAVYHASAEGTEWLCITDIGATANSAAWEEMGNPLVDNHIHDLNITASAQLQSNISANGSVTANITKNAIYTQATRSTNVAVGPDGTVNVVSSLGTPSRENVVTGYPNTTNAKFLTGLGTAVSSNAIAGYNSPISNNAVTSVTSTKNSAVNSLTSTTPTIVTIPNVTAVGSASTWNFSVNTTTGVLTINGANSTPPTLGTAIKASRIGANGNTAVYTSYGTANFVDSVSFTNTTKFLTGLGTATSANAISGYSKTPNTTALTGLGDPGTANVITDYPNIVNNTTVLTGVKVTTQPAFTLTTNSSSGTGRVITGYNVTSNPTNISVSGTAPGVTVTLSNKTTGKPKAAN